MKNQTYKSVDSTGELMPEGIGPTKRLPRMTLLMHIIFVPLIISIIHIILVINSIIKNKASNLIIFIVP